MTCSRRIFRRLLMFVVGSSVIAVAATASEEDAIWGANVLENPSFEAGGSQWWMQRAADTSTEGEPFYSEVEIDETVARDGEKSARLAGDAKTNFWRSLESAWVEVKGGSRYKFGGWIKTKDVQQESGQYYNCNLYIRFTNKEGAPVEIGGARVRATERLLGTHDWTKLEQIITAPNDAARARVGCVLTCTGTAWFDEVGFHALEAVEWESRKTDRFVFYWEKGDAPPEGAVEALESHLQSIEEAVKLTVDEKLAYYKYKDRERKRLLTGKDLDAHSDGTAIHTVSWEDRHVIPYIVVQQLGSSIPLFSEGIAVHLAGAWAGQDVHIVARSLAQEDRLLPIGQLLERSSFRSFAQDTTYPQAGSFVRYLIDLSGIEKFKQLYPVGPNEGTLAIAARFQSIYGLSLTDAESAWVKFLVPEPKMRLNLGNLTQEVDSE